MLAAVAQKDVRYYLNGVNINGNRLEATNGHYIFTATFPETIGDNQIFNLIGAKIPANAYMTEFSKIEVDENEEHEEHESVENAGKTVAIHKDRVGNFVGCNIVNVIDGKYPDIDRTVKDFKETPVSTIGFNSVYMGLPSKLFGKNADNMKFTFGGERSATKVDFNKYNEMNGFDIELQMILMPVNL